MELSYIQIETIIYIAAILVVALVFFITLRLLFKVALISTINREKIFQNLDNWTGKIFWYGFLIGLAKKISQMNQKEKAWNELQNAKYLFEEV